MKKTVIIVGSLMLIGIATGVGIYFYRKGKKVSSKDFDDVYNIAKTKGYDIFEASPETLAVIRNNYINKISAKEHNAYKNILLKGTSGLSPSDISFLLSITKKIAPSKQGKSIISQQEADKIMVSVNDFVKEQNDKFGGMTTFSNNIKNNMLKPLYDGGYKVVDNKAVKQ